MKPQTATAITVSILLVGSALSVGARFTIDRQNAASEAKKEPAGALARAPDDSRKTLKPERPIATPSNPEAVAQRLRAIFATSNEADCARALLDLVSTFKADDWALALDTMTKVGANSGGPWHLMVISAWTDLDPQAAMAWALDRKMESYVIPVWIQKDPDAAMAFIKSRDKLGPRERGLFVDAMGALGEDLPRIREIMMAVPEQSGRMLVEQAHPKISKIPADTLYTWADSFEGARREQAMHLVLNNLEGVDAKLAFARRFPDDIGPAKYGTIYKDWVTSDEAGAIKALEELEPGPMHQSALCGVAHGLFMKGRLAESLALTRRWPEEITPSFLSDLLFISDLKDAPLVLAEIPRLQDGPLKVNRYQCVLEPWFKENPAAARKWLAENEVPEQIRKEFEGK